MNRNPNYRSWYADRRRKRAKFLLLAVFACALLIGACAPSFYKDTPVTITVTGKESVNTNDGHEYRVYTKDETYVMKDSIFKARFRTSNEYGALQAGKTYRCTAFGWRVPLFSMFKNIRDCKEVSRDTT